MNPRVILLVLTLKYSCCGHLKYEDYCKLNCDDVEHTVCRRKDEMCGTVDKCSMEAMTIEMRRAVLDVHNHFRNKLASGKESALTMTAANMMTINYNMELEKIASCHANECIESKDPHEHDVCRRTSKFEIVGQSIQHYYSNRYIGQSWKSYKHIYEHLETGWYGELIGLDESAYTSYEPKTKPEYIGPVGHYSQFVWGSTEYIGCAAATQTNEDSPEKDKFHFLLVCNYGPGGNILNKTIFIQGEACTRCPEQAPCENEKYPALCGKTGPLPGDEEEPEYVGGRYNSEKRFDSNSETLIFFLLVIKLF